MARRVPIHLAPPRDDWVGGAQLRRADDCQECHECYDCCGCDDCAAGCTCHVGDPVAWTWRDYLYSGTVVFSVISMYFGVSGQLDRMDVRPAPETVVMNYLLTLVFAMKIPYLLTHKARLAVASMCSFIVGYATLSVLSTVAYLRTVA